MVTWLAAEASRQKRAGIYYDGNSCMDVRRYLSIEVVDKGNGWCPTTFGCADIVLAVVMLVAVVDQFSQLARNVDHGLVCA